MTALDHIKSADLDAARDALQADIRKAPQDARLRVFLFQLLCVQGDWSRAIQQLKAAATLDPQAGPMAQMYREAIVCEVYREKVFAGEKAPLIFGEPDDWIAWLVEALQLETRGDLQGAEALRAQAFEHAPATQGAINGAPFAWIADADPRLGPVLELVVNGKYFWVPFDAMYQIKIDAPADLRDTVWLPATITWANGGDAIGLIPTRYIGSQTPRQKLARDTQWLEIDGKVRAGLGQRMLVTDQSDTAVMDIRSLTLTPEGASDG